MSSPARAAVRRATLTGSLAVLLWSTLPLLTSLAHGLPPLQLEAMAFALAAALAAGRWCLRGRPLKTMLIWPPIAWVIGVSGLFGYHFCYFLALRHAPAAEASLINHLWPLLIVVFSALLPGERLRWWHVAGAACGLAGAVLLVTEGGGVAFRAEHAFGYAMALACAVIWSSYSLLNRRFAGTVPSEALGAFCAVTALLAFVCHLAVETSRWPAGGEWLTVLAMGLGPLGLAFFVWDHGCKRGDIRVLGAIAYLTPLLATGLLVATGLAPPSPLLAAACLLIAGGSALASRDLWRPGRDGAAVDDAVAVR